MARNWVIVEAVLAGQSHGAVAERYGVSKVWVGKLVARWREGGWDAVAPRSKRSRSNPNATGAETIEAIVRLRTDLLAQGLDAVPQTLARSCSATGRTTRSPPRPRSGGSSPAPV